MKPLFTIHAGEYLVGSHIENQFKDWRVWIPSKDTGIDLLVSNADNSKTASIQVKFQKTFWSHMENQIIRANWFPVVGGH